MTSINNRLASINIALDLAKSRISALQALCGAGNPEASLKHIADSMMLCGNINRELVDISDYYSRQLWKQERQKAQRMA